ncbi:PIG-L family deacetylase [Streptomyces stramineus]
MLGLDRFAPWKKSVLDLGNGVKAETNELVNGARKAQLIFLNIAMMSAGEMRLPLLWERPRTAMQSLVATGSPAPPAPSTTTTRWWTRWPRSWTGSSRPWSTPWTRTPTTRSTTPPTPRTTTTGPAPTTATTPRRRSSPGRRSPSGWPTPLSATATPALRHHGLPRLLQPALAAQSAPEVVEQKHRLVAAYGGDPQWECGNPGGCGDYGQGGDRPLKNRKGWIRSTHYRYKGATTAPGTDKAGRLEAYGVLGLQAVRWQETSAGSGRWGEPQNLGGGPWPRRRHRQGRRRAPAGVRPAVLRPGKPGPPRHPRDRGAGAARPGRAVQSLAGPRQPRAPPRPRPPGGHAGRRGHPDGRVHLFVRNAGKGVSGRVREADGKWGRWQSLHGEEIQDGLTVVLDARQRVHVFGEGRDTVHHWTQDEPGKPVRHQPVKGLPQPGGLPGAALGPDGELALVYRTPATLQPAVYRFAPGPDDSAGDFGDIATTELQDFAGYGPLAAHTLAARGGKDTVMVLGRALNGEIQLTDGGQSDAELVRSPASWCPWAPPGSSPTPVTACAWWA